MPWAKIRGQPHTVTAIFRLESDQKLNMLPTVGAGVAAKIGAGVVARLANIPDIRCTGRLAITNFGSQRTRISLC